MHEASAGREAEGCLSFTAPEASATFSMLSRKHPRESSRPALSVPSPAGPWLWHPPTGRCIWPSPRPPSPCSYLHVQSSDHSVYLLLNNCAYLLLNTKGGHTAHPSVEPGPESWSVTSTLQSTVHYTNSKVLENPAASQRLEHKVS